MITTAVVPASEDTPEYRARLATELADWRQAVSPPVLVAECAVHPSMLGPVPAMCDTPEGGPRLRLLCAGAAIEVMFELHMVAAVEGCPFLSSTSHMVERWVRPTLKWLGLPHNLTQPSFGHLIKVKTTPNHGHTMHIYFPK